MSEEVSALSRRFQVSKQEFQDHLPLTQRVQADFREDVEELRAQEGWDEETWRGAEEWVDDTASIWRALRRNRYDESKTHAFLLAALPTRITRGLHAPIPHIEPLNVSPLFCILPLPTHTDKLNRPVAVLTVREVVRDEDGSLDDVKEWIWWMLEMGRRTLRDYWVCGLWNGTGAEGYGRGGKRRGDGGEGMVLLVDAAGAGYRNLEVDLLPTLLSVGHNSFPGMIEAVYVVNAGWTHRSMWGVIKRVLPRSALERVVFLDTKETLEEVFDLEKLPEEFGGKNSFSFTPETNTIYNHYSRFPSHLFPSHSISRVPSRVSSMSSIADVYYTARNTPASSRRATPAPSRRNSSGVGVGPGLRHYGTALRMTKSRDERDQGRRATGGDGDGEGRLKRVLSAPSVAVVLPTPSQPPSDQEDDFEVVPTPVLSRRSSSKRHSRSHSPVPSPSPGPIQRIKSLSNFHLYLSPSRLANIDLLSDSDSSVSDLDDTPPPPPPPPSAPRRRALRPAMLEKPGMGLAGRRERPPLSLTGLPSHLGAESDPVRTYSGRLQQHHAQWLDSHRGSPDVMEFERRVGGIGDAGAEAEGANTITVSPTTHTHPLARSVSLEPSPSPSPPPTPSPLISPSLPQPTSPAVITAYSTSNPFFGYPVVRSGSGIRPRYPRNRKRDLVKTLLFLFMLKLQSWRDTLERSLGLNRLRIPSFTSSSRPPRTPSRQGSSGPGRLGPSEGLVRSAVHGKEVIRRDVWDKDWWWMIIGFLLLRGTWARLVLAPMEVLGWDGWRGILGVA
ncbi:hypothetical protein IAT38_005048 [Cryptococcus sp. DSM 104549]